MDPLRPNREVLSAITGVYVSKDDGQDWRRLNDLPEAEFHTAHFNEDGTVILFGISGDVYCESIFGDLRAAVTTTWAMVWKLCDCGAGFFLSHPSYVRMGHPANHDSSLWKRKSPVFQSRATNFQVGQTAISSGCPPSMIRDISVIEFASRITASPLNGRAIKHRSWPESKQKLPMN